MLIHRSLPRFNRTLFSGTIQLTAAILYLKFSHKDTIVSWCRLYIHCRGTMQKYFFHYCFHVPQFKMVSLAQSLLCACHDDVIKWKSFPRYWPFVWGIHLSPVNSPYKGQWRGALMFSVICALNKRLSKQLWGWWFETPSRPLWRHGNGGLNGNINDQLHQVVLILIRAS